VGAGRDERQPAGHAAVPRRGDQLALVGLAAGATTVLADDARPATIARQIAEAGVTHAFLVPSMLGALAREVGPAPDAFPSLRTVVYGGSPISEAERRDATTVLGPVLRQVYGMTETTGGFTELEPDPADRTATPAAGRPDAHTPGWTSRSTTR
jgi:long-chain acyl-CoA synthetase